MLITCGEPTWNQLGTCLESTTKLPPIVPLDCSIQSPEQLEAGDAFPADTLLVGRWGHIIMDSLHDGNYKKQGYVQVILSTGKMQVMRICQVHNQFNSSSCDAPFFPTAIAKDRQFAPIW